MDNMAYHDKKYEHKTLFCHNEEQEKKLQKEAKKRHITKSEVIRQLINKL